MHAALSRGCSRVHLSLFYAVRHASTSSNPFPYPNSTNPSPHQIFHLPSSASQKDVKSRYYELVRIYHPDSAVARAYPPEVAQARFHAISKAYDVLRGRRRSLASEDDAPVLRNDCHDLSTAIWRAKQRQRADDLYVPHDDRWKDRIILGAIVIAAGVLVLQTNLARRKTINEMAHPYPHHSAQPNEKLTRTSSKSDEELLAAPEDDVSLPEKAQPAS